MAKKKIGIDQLQVGMFMEADVRDAAKGGPAAGKKNVLLLGKGMLITSDNQIRRLKEAGLKNVTIDTSKGKDLPGGGQVVAPPPVVKEIKKAKPPAGRKTFFKDEIKVARKIRGASVQIVRSSWGTLQPGAALMRRR
ncbi:MAG: DUF3391 domain-containing protein [bacterium]|nr:DUF3391 domain-containing protein [bacterium]